MSTRFNTGTAALIVAAFAAAHGSASAATRHGLGAPSLKPVHGRRLPPPPRPAPIPLGGRHHAGPLATQYTIADVGAPSPSNVVVLEQPASFNNTGQIVGYAYNYQNGTSNCMAYTGSKWLRLNAFSFRYCTPQSITNANPSTGTYEIVGYGDPQNSVEQNAFTATVVKSVAHFADFTGHAPSALYGVNNSGAAVGYSYYNPPKGFFESDPPFVESNGKFAPLQPQCTTNQPLCMQDVESSWWDGDCAFGGCSINDAGVVLGYGNNGSSYGYEIYTVGQPSSGEILPMSYDVSYVAGINDANQIAYSQYTYSGDTWSAWIYQVGASAPTSLGTIPGDSCSYEYVMGQNNNGQVLGYSGGCQNESYTYWTWDPVNGMVDLDAEIGQNSYSSITPYGINDNGQILVELETSTGHTHWGTLDPSGSLLRRGAVTHKG
jgi:hypothetical protein